MALLKSRKSNLVCLFIFFLALILILMALKLDKTIQKIRYPLKYKESILEYSKMYSIDPYLITSIIWVESRFNSDAVSIKDARGLMQILPSTAIWCAEKINMADYKDDMLFDPKVNIELGCWYINYLSSQFPDSIELVLASYNGGIGNVLKWLKDEEYSEDGKSLDNIPYDEINNYISIVMKTYEVYKNLYSKELDIDSL